jgi:hypothetical protein
MAEFEKEYFIVERIWIVQADSIVEAPNEAVTGKHCQVTVKRTSVTEAAFLKMLQERLTQEGRPSAT